MSHLKTLWLMPSHSVRGTLEFIQYSQYEKFSFRDVANLAVKTYVIFAMKRAEKKRTYKGFEELYNYIDIQVDVNMFSFL